MSYVTTPDTNFSAHLTALASTSAAAAKAALYHLQRKWMYPPLGTWDGNPTKITAMNAAFDRTALNQAYIDILVSASGTGTIGESMVVKLQIDYVAALERAFRTRHYTSVRARIHAASRRRGQGKSAGLFTGSILTWINDLITASHG